MTQQHLKVASREGGRGLKQQLQRLKPLLEQSPPVRGAWIETRRNPRRSRIASVASREGGVD